MGCPFAHSSLCRPQPPPYHQPHASLRQHNVSPWSLASRDVLCDSRCKENEQAAERLGDKKSTLSSALKGLPERRHMHVKKNTPVGTPLLAPAGPHPNLPLMLHQDVSRLVRVNLAWANSRQGVRVEARLWSTVAQGNFPIPRWPVSRQCIGLRHQSYPHQPAPPI